MRVLFVHSRMVAGGVERVTLTLMRELQRRNIDCCLGLRRSHGEFMNEAREVTDVVELAAGGLHQFVPNLVRLIRDWSPTHLVTAAPDVALLTMIARRLSSSGSQLVAGVHLTHAPVVSSHGAASWLRYKLDRMLARIVYKRADAVVVVSEGLRKELRQEFHVPESRLFLIYNPAIDDSEECTAARPDQRRKGQPTKFVCIGRLSRQKGIDVLIHALAQVGDQHAWSLEIYGSGPEQTVLQKLSERLGLKSRITFRGHAPDPFSVLVDADWLVMPSRYEGFGLVLVEALARGVPAIASDCPHGPREILKDGELGLLVAPDNPRSLADAIVKVLSGAIRFDSAALIHRAADFTVKRSVEHWQKLLRSMSARER